MISRVHSTFYLPGSSAFLCSGFNSEGVNETKWTPHTKNKHTTHGVTAAATTQATTTLWGRSSHTHSAAEGVEDTKLTGWQSWDINTTHKTWLPTSSFQADQAPARMHTLQTQLHRRSWQLVLKYWRGSGNNPHVSHPLVSLRREKQTQVWACLGRVCGAPSALARAAISLTHFHLHLCLFEQQLDCCDPSTCLTRWINPLAVFLC